MRPKKEHKLVTVKIYTIIRTEQTEMDADAQ